MLNKLRHIRVEIGLGHELRQITSFARPYFDIRRGFGECIIFAYISTIRQGSDECCRVFATLPMYPKNGYIAMYAIFAYMDSQG